MITCRVELYGMSAEAAGIREVEPLLEDGVGVPELITALVRKIPSLDGTICLSGTNLIADDQILNVNSRFYDNGDNLVLKQGNVVRILTKATGG